MTQFLTYMYLLAAVIYVLFILFCWMGWRRTSVQIPINYNPSTSVSVIIPARNEEENILNCLEDLADQKYPAALYEIIIVDDDSSDGTSRLVREFTEVNHEKSIRLIQLQQDDHKGLFKKMAITKGIEEARGQLILTSDADCRLSPDWISAFVQHYEITKAALISGPVCFKEEQSFFEKMQTLEFIGLIGIGAGTIQNGLYMMCNGANLAYSKKVFHDVAGFQTDSISSGDDTQLMLKIAAGKSGRISFLKSREAIVFTSARTSLSELIRQRKRWASKIPGHSSLFTLIIALSAYLLHAGIIASIAGMAASSTFYGILLLPLALKCLVEFLLLLDVANFFNRKKLLWLFLPAQIIYPVYIVIIGSIAPFGTYLWKGRRVK